MLRPFTMLLVAASVLDAQSRPDFTGTWQLDPARSESAAQGIPVGRVTLVIKQGDSDISVETRRFRDDKPEPAVETLLYRLDGSEVTTLRTPDGPPVRTRAHWDGSKLVMETGRTINGAAVTITHALSLDAGGKLLNIDKTLAVQHGYQGKGGRNTGSGRDVYVRVKEGSARN
jgi:hypothetical protein